MKKILNIILVAIFIILLIFCFPVSSILGKQNLIRTSFAAINIKLAQGIPLPTNVQSVCGGSQYCVPSSIVNRSTLPSASVAVANQITNQALAITQSPCSQVAPLPRSVRSRIWHHHKHVGQGSNGAISRLLQQLINMLIQFLNQIVAKLGGNPIAIPGSGTPSETPISSGASLKSSGIINNPSTIPNPCPTISTPPATSVSSAPVTGVTEIPVTVVTAAPVTVVTVPPVSSVTQAAVPSVFPPDDVGSIWAGYAYTLPSGLTSGLVTSTWTTTQLTCGSTDATISPWVGMGGYATSDPNIAQSGTDQTCLGGASVYKVWTEAYPAGLIYYDNDKVSQGDQITATVTFQGGGKFTTNIKDTTAGWSIDTPMSFSGYTPQNGEVIAEGPVDGYTTIPTFVPLSFTNSNFSNNGGSQQQLVTAPGLDRMELSVNNKAATKTSALSGGSFTISNL